MARSRPTSSGQSWNILSNVGEVCEIPNFPEIDIESDMPMLPESAAPDPGRAHLEGVPQVPGDCFSFTGDYTFRTWSPEILSGFQRCTAMALLLGIGSQLDRIDTETGSVIGIARFTAFRTGSGGRECDQGEPRQSGCTGRGAMNSPRNSPVPGMHAAPDSGIVKMEVVRGYTTSPACTSHRSNMTNKNNGEHPADPAHSDDRRGRNRPGLEKPGIAYPSRGRSSVFRAATPGDHPKVSGRTGQPHRLTVRNLIRT